MGAFLSPEFVSAAMAFKEGITSVAVAAELCPRSIGSFSSPLEFVSPLLALLVAALVVAARIRSDFGTHLVWFLTVFYTFLMFFMLVDGS